MPVKFDNYHKHFYKDEQGNPRKYGIYSPGLDRFIFIAENDIWITLETAEIISSKLPTMVFVLPKSDITNETCMQYAIGNKPRLKVNNSTIYVGRQNPLLRMLYDDDVLVNEGLPKDYIDRQDVLDRLKSYTAFVNEQLYAINIANSFYNFIDTKSFMTNYIPESWTTEISTFADRSSVKQGIFFQLKHILYMSNDQYEAENKIQEFWLEHAKDQTAAFLHGYYKVLGQKIPTKLQHLAVWNPTETSTFLF